MYKGQLYEIIMFREVGVKAFLPAQSFCCNNSHFLNMIYFMPSTRMRLETSILSKGGRKKTVVLQATQLLCFNGFVLYLLQQWTIKVIRICESL